MPTSPADTSGSGRVSTKSSPSASTRMPRHVDVVQEAGRRPAVGDGGGGEVVERVGADRLAGEVGRAQQRDAVEGLAHVLEPGGLGARPRRAPRVGVARQRGGQERG